MIAPSVPRPVLIPEGHQPAFADAIRRVVAETDTNAAVVRLDEARPQDLYAVAGGVGLVAVRGYLADRLSVHGSEWATGYNAIRLAVAAAQADPRVKAVALDIDSGGGMVSGCFELVDWLRASRANGKPLVAIVSDWAASAAYALACGCESISAPRTGAVGSIGVVRMHVDFSRMLEQDGIKVSLIHAGRHKVDGNPFEPLPEEVRGDWQAQLEAYRRLFAEEVARGRGLTIEAVLATEARLYEGPVGTAEAKRIGLIDGVLAPDDALAAVMSHLAAV